MADWFNPLDVAGAPVYGVLDAVSQFPGLRDTQFQNWLEDNWTWGGREFRDEHPGWAMGADVAASFIPYVGWGTALNRAAAAGRVGGALGLTNRLGTGTANLLRGRPIAAFAAGESVRYAPVAAAMTAFDTLSGKIESPIDAITSFGLGTIGGGLIQAGGHALSPMIARNAPDWLSGAWRAAFEPGPELSALYGFTDNTRRAAAQMARVPAVQSVAQPELEPQQRAAGFWDLIQEQRAGMHPEVDPDILQGQYDQEIRAILHSEPDAVDRVFRWGPHDNDRPVIKNTVDSLLRMGATREGDRVRVPITSSGRGIENPDVLAATLALPEGWIHDTIWPGIMQTTPISGTNLRHEIGLGKKASARFTNLERVTPGGRTQNWSVRQEQDGMWLMTVQVPGRHPMTGRARYNTGKNATEEGRAFFSFKTPNPSKFLPDMRADIDSPVPGRVWSVDDRVARGQSAFLDRLMDFRRIFLAPETIRAGYQARPGGREALAREMLAGPAAGEDIMQWFKHYTAPTDHQLDTSPEGRGILSLYQAAFDAAEGRKGALLYGTSSIPEDKSPIGALISFKGMNIDDETALATQLRRAMEEDPGALEVIRKFDKIGHIPLESLAESAAGRWLTMAIERNQTEIKEINAAIKALRDIGATDAKLIPVKENHFGLSRTWDGSIFVPIYKEGRIEPVAVVAGGSKAHAERKAKDWIAALEASGESFPGKHRAGQAYISGETDAVPGWIRASALNPGLLEPRAGMRGYEHEFEPYKHVDDFIAELDDNYLRRWRYAASTIADALSTGKINQLKARDAKSFSIVQTRINQLKGQPGPIEQRMNQIVDAALAPMLGTNSFSKIADAANEFNFHLLHGVGYIGTPLLNMTSVLQTHLPEGVNFLTSAPEILQSVGYQLPRMGPDGLPTKGFNFVADPIGLLWGAVRRASDPDEETKAIYQELFNRREMGTGLANEYTGQDRSIALRASEGVRGAGDLGFWFKKASSLLMSKTEQVSRTLAAGMAMEAMAKYEAVHGVKFTMDQKIANALKYVRRTNYGYFTSDRPMMFTTPAGAIFGNQKTWMTNYMWMMGHYLGLGKDQGNWAPLLFTLGTTTALGGVFAVPVLGWGLDAASKFFEDEPAMEYIYSRMGEGGNGIAFGLPGLFGISLQGNVAAPGSNLAHDAEFLTSVILLDRAMKLGQAIGRGWDDQTLLGMNPAEDPMFRRQIANVFAPRSLTRAMDAIHSDTLYSSATGNPAVEGLTPGARVLHGLGFREIDVAVQYAAYENMIRDRNAMRHRIGVFGDAYAQASLRGDRVAMMETLQAAAVAGVDMSSVMRSAQTRLRNAERDMIGRNFNEEQQAAYQATLAIGGR